MNSKFRLVALAALAVFAVSCNQNPKSRTKHKKKDKQPETTVQAFPRISQPQLAIGCQSNVFDVSKGAQINFESGAKVIVPENAFVDEDGNPVTGEVKLDFAEYNDPASIIASGLPMCLIENGKTGHMESAGMFEINAKQKGKNLQLAEGKTIEIRTVSEKPGDFNFYQYDTGKNSWVEQTKSKLNASVEPASMPRNNNTTLGELAIDSMSPAQPPIKPQKAQRTDLVFELDVKNAGNYGLDFGNLLWKFADGNGKDKQWLFNKKWASLEISGVNPKTGSCTIKALSFSTAKEAFDAIREVQVVPVLFGKDYKKAMLRYQVAMQDYVKAQEKVKMDQDMAAAQSKFIRAVSVQSMGVYNCDRILKKPEFLVLNATFDFEGEYKDKALPVVYMIMDNGELITFYNRSEGNFAFNPNKPNTLVAVMPNSEIAIMKTKDIPSDQLNESLNTKTISLSLKPSGVKVSSTDELNDFIRANS